MTSSPTKSSPSTDAPPAGWVDYTDIYWSGVGRGVNVAYAFPVDVASLIVFRNGLGWFWGVRGWGEPMMVNGVWDACWEARRRVAMKLRETMGVVRVEEEK